MLELPEVIHISRQLGEQVTGKKVIRVLPPTKNHKFCWYNGAPEEYEEMIEGAAIEGAEGFGIYVEIRFSNGCKLCFNDGVNVRLIKTEALPKAYQLAIAFEDGEALVFTVAMYGGIILHRGEYDNEYYQKSREALSPFSGEFRAYYDKGMAQSDTERQGIPCYRAEIPRNRERSAPGYPAGGGNPSEAQDQYA